MQKDATNTDHSYDPQTINEIHFVYALATLIWLWAVVQFDLFATDNWLTGIALLPLLVYIVSDLSLAHITVESEEKLFPVSYLTTVIIIILPLATWLHDKHRHRTRIIWMMAAAAIIAIISLTNVWVPARFISVIRHARGAMQAASLSLILGALYLMFFRAESIGSDDPAGPDESVEHAPDYRESTRATFPQRPPGASEISDGFTRDTDPRDADLETTRNIDQSLTQASGFSAIGAAQQRQRRR